MADNNVDITAAQDGALYNALSGGQDFIIKGIKNEMRISNTTSSLQISINTGEAIVCGRHVTITAPVQLTLGSYSKYFVVLRVNLAQSAGNEGSIVGLTAYNQIKSENLNNNGNIHDILLYEVTTTSNGVSVATDRRSIKESILADLRIDAYSKNESDNLFLKKSAAGTQVIMEVSGNTLTIRSK